MSINSRICTKCKKLTDLPTCPYCGNKSYKQNGTAEVIKRK